MRQRQIEDIHPDPVRPLTGMDILLFQGRHGMDKEDVCYYLGITQFQETCALPQIPYTLELLMRLFDEDPTPPPFKKDRITLPALFQQMYGKKLKTFAGTEHEVEARVDLQNRFSMLLGRSKGRAYRWLDEQAIRSGKTRAHDDILGILGKLTQRSDPGEALERMGSYVWRLRGIDIDQKYPIPTLKNPPKREKRGRKPAHLKKDEEVAATNSKTVKSRVVLLKKK